MRLIMKKDGWSRSAWYLKLFRFSRHGELRNLSVRPQWFKWFVPRSLATKDFTACFATKCVPVLFSQGTNSLFKIRPFSFFFFLLHLNLKHLKMVTRVKEIPIRLLKMSYRPWGEFVALTSQLRDTLSVYQHPSPSPAQGSGPPVFPSRWG